MAVKFTQNFVMAVAFYYYYKVYRNFVALTYKAVQCFQKCPMIYINLSSVSHFLCCEAFLM